MTSASRELDLVPGGLYLCVLPSGRATLLWVWAVGPWGRLDSLLAPVQGLRHRRSHDPGAVDGLGPHWRRLL